jgi:hypothetical protein
MEELRYESIAFHALAVVVLGLLFMITGVLSRAAGGL